MAYGAKSKQPEAADDAPPDTWALKALRSLLGFDPVPIIQAMQTEIPDTAAKMKQGIESMAASLKNIDARLAAIERKVDNLSGDPQPGESTNAPNGSTESSRTSHGDG